MLKKSSFTRLGIGLYSVPQAARLMRTPPAKIRRWLAETDLVPRQLPEDEEALTFAELMELFFIKMFRDEGVSLATIRHTSQAAAKKYRTDYPFSVRRFDTDGKTIFATLIEQASEKVVLEDLKRGQLCFEQVLRPFFRKLDFDGDAEVARFWPRDRTGRIVLDPTRKFGRPIDAESGVPTWAIYSAFTAGNGQDVNAVAGKFEVSLDSVEAAIEFEQSLIL